MSDTNTFFLWFLYNGLSGLGGWFIFLCIALIAVIWLFYDSARRRLPVLGWRLGISISVVLILPTILYRFTVVDISDVAKSLLGPFSEPIFYLGVLGGVLPLVLAIGYFISYQGLIGCPLGHVYEVTVGDCPHPDHLPPASAVDYKPPDFEFSRETDPPITPDVQKELTQAWLVSKDGQSSFQLYVNETRIGRSLDNDIVLKGDRSVSRESARVLEHDGHFRLYSLTAARYPRVANQTVRESILLEDEDDIEFGENTVLQFIKSK